MEFSLVVLLYAERRLQQALRYARFLAANTAPSRCVFVINGDQITESAVRALWSERYASELIRHDNSGVEFGGYQAGIDRLSSALPDRLIILNDTLGTHDLMSEPMLSGFLRRLRFDLDRFVVGKIDDSHRRLTLDGLWATRWIRSHLMGFDRSAIDAIDSRLYHPHIDALIRPVGNVDAFFDRAIGAGVRELISLFLFKPGPWSWYAAEPLNEANCAAMAVKARAILQEKYLSMKLESRDTAFWEAYLTRGDELRHRGSQVVEFVARRLRFADQTRGGSRSRSS